MNAPEHTPTLEQRRAGKRRSWLWLGLLCAALTAIAYRAHRPSQAPSRPAVAKKAPPATGPRLSVSVWADGAPLPGAKVLVHGPSCQARGRADEEGLVRIEDCRPGRLQATVESPGYVRVERSVVLDAAGSLERVDLQPGERLEGLILDESGRPMPGVTVTARLLGPTPYLPAPSPWLALSGNDGKFAIESLPQGHLVLDVSDGGAHEPVSLTDVSVPSGPLSITLRRTAAISGKVSLPDGKGVANASVTLAGSGVWPARVTQTDPAGAFSFEGVPEGIYELRADHDSWVSAPLEGVQVQPGSHAQIELQLAPGVSLTGRVRAASSGRALHAELQVMEEALSGSERRVQTGQDGGFEVPGLRPLPHRVTIQSRGYVAQQRWLTPGRAVVIELLRAAAASGRVEDSAGRPVAHAAIEVKGRSVTGQPVLMLGPVQEAPAPMEADAHLIGGTSPGLGVTTGAVPRVPILPLPAGVAPGSELGFQSDELGEFHIDGLPPGQLSFTARKPGMSAGHSAALKLRAGTTRGDIVIVLPAGVILRGRVQDARGDAVAHVRVDLVSGADLPRSTTSAADGSFVFESARGDCSLWARPFGAPATKLTGSAQQLAEQDLVLTLQRSTDRLEGRVSDAHGQPVENASVRLEVPQSPGYTPTVLSAADGSFELSGLPPPPYLISAQHPDYSPARKQTVETTRDPVELQLQRGVQLRGSVRDALGSTPLVAAQVLFRGTALVQSTRSAADGSFELQHLPEGPYRLSVSAQGYVTQTSEDTLSATDAAPAPLRFELTKTASISGDVVDRLGRTVWNAQVAVGAPPDWSRATRTDHAGHFRLQGVAEGEHSLSARHGALLTSNAQPVRVVEGEDTPGVVVRLPGIVDEEIADEAPAQTQPKPSAPLAFAMRGAAVLVEHVAPQSAAGRSGLRQGDILLTVNGEPVRSAAQARGMLAHVPGRHSSWLLKVRRDQRLVQLRYATR